MIWAILALLGVPLWLCALGILALVFRNRALRKRPGNISVRVRRPGRRRWTRANALWVSDVFMWRASPAAWTEEAQQIDVVILRSATSEERKKLRHLDENAAIVTMTCHDGMTFDAAAARGARDALLGPHLRDQQPSVV